MCIRITPYLLILFIWCKAATAITDIAYVVKVDNALVYLDIGTKAGAQVGDWYVILDTLVMTGSVAKDYDRIGEVRLLRVLDDVSIAEVMAVVDDKELELLQRAMPALQWASMEDQRRFEQASLEIDSLIKKRSKPVQPRVISRPRRIRSIYLLGGSDWNKNIDLQWNTANQLIGATAVTDRSLGMRLATSYGAWRLNLTYRVAGKLLGTAEADITQLGLAMDVHYLVTRTWPPKLYLGSGLGVQQMDWQAHGDVRQSRRKIDTTDSITRWGGHLVAGSEWGLGSRWFLAFEGGYYYIFKWQGLIGGEGWKSRVGIGQKF